MRATSGCASEGAQESVDGVVRLVPRPFLAPMRCAALAHVGQTARTRWVDTGVELAGFDNHVYLSETAVVEAGRLLGHPSKGEFWEACQDRDRAREELENVKRMLIDAERKLAAVEVLKQGGFTQTRKPGRPRKETADAA